MYKYYHLEKKCDVANRILDLVPICWWFNKKTNRKIQKNVSKYIKTVITNVNHVFKINNNNKQVKYVSMSNNHILYFILIRFSLFFFLKTQNLSDSGASIEFFWTKFRNKRYRSRRDLSKNTSYIYFFWIFFHSGHPV